MLFRKARRRHPGVYWYRTARHGRRGSEWGYVGKSNHLTLRADCHEGRCTRHPACAGGKPWADLIIRRRHLELPWWLGWQPVTLSLEALVILVLRPRYNWQKNPRWSKVPPAVQKLQRAQRDSIRAQFPGSEIEFGARAGRLVPVFGIALIVIGLSGWWLTR